MRCLYVEEFRNINMKSAVMMGMCFYSLTILIHVLIISGIIPFTWVNGGRSESFATQLPISIINIIICIIGGVFTLIIGGNIYINTKENNRYMLGFCCTLDFWVYTTIVRNTI